MQTHYDYYLPPEISYLPKFFVDRTSENYVQVAYSKSSTLQVMTRDHNTNFVSIETHFPKDLFLQPPYQYAKNSFFVFYLYLDKIGIYRNYLYTRSRACAVQNHARPVVVIPFPHKTDQNLSRKTGKEVSVLIN